MLLSILCSFRADQHSTAKAAVRKYRAEIKCSDKTLVPHNGRIISGQFESTNYCNPFRTSACARGKAVRIAKPDIDNAYQKVAESKMLVYPQFSKSRSLLRNPALPQLMLPAKAFAACEGVMTNSAAYYGYIAESAITAMAIQQPEGTGFEGHPDQRGI